MYDVRAVSDRGGRGALMADDGTRARGLTRRTKALTGGLLAAALVVGGAVAVVGGGGKAEGPAVYRQENGVVAVSWDAIDRAWYRGEVVPLGQVEDGSPPYSSHSIELACHGVIAYFDTAAEEQAYGRGYTARAKAVAEKREALAPGTDPADSDPCAWWKGPVPELPGLA
jgi:hypothetical protein